MSGKTPKVFHFVFGLKPQDTPLSLVYYLCLASCIQVMRPDKIYFYYHYEPWGQWWDDIKGHLTLEKIDINREISEFHYEKNRLDPYRYAHLADVARLDAIYDRGGIYADMDSIFLQPLPEEFYDAPFVMGREKVDLKAPGAVAGGSLCNAWMMGPAKAEFVRHWREELPGAFDGSWSNHATFLPYTLSQRYPELISVQPEEAFFAYSWTPEDVDALFTKPIAKDLSQSYSLHLWNHLWMERKRLSHSAFCEDMLTPAYVGWSNSAYATLAKPFLRPELIPPQSVYEREVKELRKLRFERNVRAALKKVKLPRLN